MFKKYTMKLFKNIYPYFLSISVFSAVIGLGACKPDKIGPDLFPATSSFSILENFKSSSNSVNFGNAGSNVSFSAKFNENVSWEIELKGLSNGAVANWSGNGTEFDADDVLWLGKSNGVPFFSTGEYVNAYLKILGHDSIYQIDSIKVESAYSYQLQTINGVKHIVIDDFEKISSKRYAPVSLAASPDGADSETNFIASSNTFIQGSRSYYMIGRDDNKNSWCGGINNENLIDFYLVDSESKLRIDSGINPNDLYFNIFVYGTGKPNTSVQLKVYELDAKSYVNATGDTVMINSREDMRNYVYNDATLPPTVNTFAAYNQANNDGYIYDIEVTWVGWKLVSAPYAKFKPANDFLMGGNGDRKKESWRVAGMAISLLSQPTPGALVDTYIDYLVITQGGKFQH